MAPKAVFAVMLLFAASAGGAARLNAQPVGYRTVESVDLLGGYVPNEEWIETTGYLWLSGGGAFFNVDQPSARAPIGLDVAHLDPETLRRVESECASPDQFSGGCWATIRGQTRLVGDRQGVRVTDVQLARPR